MWNFFCSLFDSTSTVPDMADISSPAINPATGLPMLGDGIGGVDVGGSPFGTDIHSSTSSMGSGVGSNPWD